MSAETLSVPILRANVLHFLGYRGRGTPARRISELLEPALAEARSLVAPRGVRRIVARERAAELGLGTGDGSCLALGLVTIGFGLERRVSALLEQGKETKALLLDAAGSAAAEEAAEELERLIHGHAGPPAFRPASRRVSPGYGSWPITSQPALFALLPHEEIDVRLLPSGLMAPRKSVSFAVWLAAREAGAPAGVADACEPCGPGRCAACDMTTCPYRETPVVPEGS